MKKFLVSAAAIAALATSAMAYNYNEIGAMDNSATTKIVTNSDESNLSVIGFDQTKLGNALVFPAYFTGNGWESTVRVINTGNNPVVAKVVLYAGKDSHEVRDFNIYLSAKDVWVGKIKVDENGKAKVVSTDDSTPLEDGSIASEDNPFGKEIDSNFGYIEVIGMAEATTVPAGYEHDHANLRKAYADFALKARNPKADGTKVTGLIFKNGVVQGKKVTLPYVDLNPTINVGIVTGVGNYTFTHPSAVLTGDVRITDTVNGKDMDMMAYKFDYNSTGTDALVYLEGEKANIADIFLHKGSNDYDNIVLKKVIDKISSSKVYLTYGDAEVNNMYALLTNPFKRVYVQAQLDADDGLLNAKLNDKIKTANAYYSDASVDKNGVINYGSTSLVAQIYDESENVMSAGQFSPATTPTIKLENEVASTGYDVNDENTLAYFLKQAQDQGYKRGFVILSNANSNNDVPGIMTQMLATKAGNKVVTNWIVPQGN